MLPTMDITRFTPSTRRKLTATMAHSQLFRSRIQFGGPTPSIRMRDSAGMGNYINARNISGRLGSIRSRPVLPMELTATTLLGRKETGCRSRRIRDSHGCATQPCEIPRPASAAAAFPELLPGTRDGQFGFSLQTMAGQRCFIEFSESLILSSWKTVEDTIGDGSTVWYGIQQSNLKAGFYRVRLDQP
jgi:hypothetical protein